MEIADIASGFMMLTVGLASGALALLYWRIGSLALLSFGLFALLYGIRFLLSAPPVVAWVALPPTVTLHVLSAVDYWLPAPFLGFLEQVLEPAMRPLFRRLRQGWCVLAPTCMAYDLAAGPGASTPLYEAVFLVGLVVVTLTRLAWRWKRRTREQQILTAGFILFLLAGLHDIMGGLVTLPWDAGFTNLGLGVFVLCLGHVTAEQFFSAQRELATVEHEMRTASAIQATLLPAGPPPVRDLDIAVRYEPMRKIGGDMYDFMAENRRAGVLVADVTGHGVPAALIAAMAKVAFASQSREATRPGQLIAGMNRMLSGHLDGQFITATYVHVDAASGLVRYTSAGHPPPLLWRAATREVFALHDGGLLMGFDPDASYATGEVSVARGDRLVAYTDGVIEAPDGRGDFFGIEGLTAFVASRGGLAADALADALLTHLRERTGSSGFDDDVTLAIVDVRGDGRS